MNIKNGILGLAIGDALGVPVELESRQLRKQNPVSTMLEGQNPAGSWSDDTSLTLCLLDSLSHSVKKNGKLLSRRRKLDSKSKTSAKIENVSKVEGNFKNIVLNKTIDYRDIMERFSKYYNNAEYTPYGKVFGMGKTTINAIKNYSGGIYPLFCGGDTEGDNGNGSLMRILPIAYYIEEFCKDMKFYEWIDIVHNVSALTHRHKRSQMSCGIYVSVAVKLLELRKSTLKENLKQIGKAKSRSQVMDMGEEKLQGFLEKEVSKSLTKDKVNSVVREGILEAMDFYKNNLTYKMELENFNRIKAPDFWSLQESEIKSDAYVIDTLEAALWCLLNTDNYSDCVLKAVNLGGDTDTIAAVAGGLSGILYGENSIPKEWKDKLARRNYIEKLCDEFDNNLSKHNMIADFLVNIFHIR